MESPYLCKTKEVNTKYISPFQKKNVTSADPTFRTDGAHSKSYGPDLWTKNSLEKWLNVVQLEETWYEGPTGARRFGHTTMPKRVPLVSFFFSNLTLPWTGSRDRPQDWTITDELDFSHGRRWPAGFHWRGQEKSWREHHGRNARYRFVVVYVIKKIQWRYLIIWIIWSTLPLEPKKIFLPLLLTPILYINKHDPFGSIPISSNSSAAASFSLLNNFSFASNGNQSCIKLSIPQSTLSNKNKFAFTFTNRRRTTLTSICGQNRRCSTQRAEVFIAFLHLDKATDTKKMATRQSNWLESNACANQATIIVNVGYDRD